MIIQVICDLSINYEVAVYNWTILNFMITLSEADELSTLNIIYVYNEIIVESFIELHQFYFR